MASGVARKRHMSTCVHRWVATIDMDLVGKYPFPGYTTARFAGTMFGVLLVSGSSGLCLHRFVSW